LKKYRKIFEFLQNIEFTIQNLAILSYLSHSSGSWAYFRKTTWASQQAAQKR